MKLHLELPLTPIHMAIPLAKENNFSIPHYPIPLTIAI
jgi:hypothetical protein